MHEKWPWFGRKEPERVERPGKREMRLRVGELGTVEIGVQGEVDAREIILDVSEWLEVWPDAVFLITHRRPTEYAAYNAAQVELRDGGQLCWTIGAEDVAIAGRGEIQIRAYEGKALVKSISGRTVIRPGIGIGEAPEAAEDWLEKVSKAGAEATKDATEVADTARRLAQILYGVITTDVFTGTKEEWEAFLDGLTSSLEKAQIAAQQAESSADEVEGYMDEANAFRDEYRDKLNALATILNSVRHRTIEEHPGWVQVDVEGLEDEWLQAFPTLDELVAQLDALTAAIQTANTAAQNLDSLRVTWQNKLDKGELRGAKGAKGDKGADGFVIRGTYETLDALEAAVKSPEAGWAYGVGADGNYTVYIWDGVKKAWVSWGSLTAGNTGIDEDDFKRLFLAMLEDEGFKAAVLAEVSANFRQLFQTEMQTVNDLDNDASGDTLAFRQAVYDFLYPVGVAQEWSYMMTGKTALTDDNIGNVYYDKGEIKHLDELDESKIDKRTIPLTPIYVAKIKGIDAKWVNHPWAFSGTDPDQGSKQVAVGTHRFIRVK